MSSLSYLPPSVAGYRHSALRLLSVSLDMNVDGFVSDYFSGDEPECVSYNVSSPGSQAVAGVRPLRSLWRPA